MAIENIESSVTEQEITECVAAVRKQLATYINADGSRGLDFESPQDEARREVGTWSPERVRNVAARRQFINELHTHSEIASLTGVTSAAAQRHWQALAEIHVTAPDGRKVRLFRDENLLFANSGCLLHLDCDKQVPEDVMDELARRNEKGATRMFRNLFHIVMDLVQRKHIEAVRMQRAVARAQKLKAIAAQVSLDFARTGTDGAE